MRGIHQSYVLNKRNMKLLSYYFLPSGFYPHCLGNQLKTQYLKTLVSFELCLP